MPLPLASIALAAVFIARDGLASFQACLLSRGFFDEELIHLSLTRVEPDYFSRFPPAFENYSHTNRQ